jgi:hypothetical protein
MLLLEQLWYEISKIRTRLRSGVRQEEIDF